MDPRPSRAETLPALYRAILDAVGELERRGERSDAARARKAASHAYAVWDDGAERRLTRQLDGLRRRTMNDDPQPHRAGRFARGRRAGRTGRAGRHDPVARGAPTR
jgi:hypothetical protein